MEPYLGEIRPFSFGFAPKGWAMCNGQILSIAQNQALFALLSVTYGGDGRTTFALPNLQSRVPQHVGGNVLGTVAGVESVTLDPTQMPAHTHGLAVSNAYSTTSPVGARPATAPAGRLDYAAATGTLASDSVTISGASQAHSNLQPLSALNFCIALQGIFPSRQ